MFYRDLFAHKILANVNFKTLRLLYAYLYDSPFQIPSISTFSLQNINLNSPFQILYLNSGKNMIWIKDGRVKVYVLREKVETDGI